MGKVLAQSKKTRFLNSGVKETPLPSMSLSRFVNTLKILEKFTFGYLRSYFDKVKQSSG